jgi:hypothetical protein
MKTDHLQGTKNQQHLEVAQEKENVTIIQMNRYWFHFILI